MVIFRWIILLTHCHEADNLINGIIKGKDDDLLKTNLSKSLFWLVSQNNIFLDKLQLAQYRSGCDDYQTFSLIDSGGWSSSYKVYVVSYVSEASSRTKYISTVPISYKKRKYISIKLIQKRTPLNELCSFYNIEQHYFTKSEKWANAFRQQKKSLKNGQKWVCVSLYCRCDYTMYCIEWYSCWSWMIFLWTSHTVYSLLYSKMSWFSPLYDRILQDVSAKAVLVSILW